MKSLLSLLLTLGLATVALGQTYELKDLSVKPKVIAQQRPVYPPELRAANQTGTVRIEFIVAPDGTVNHAAVIQSDNSGLDAAALAAVSGWKFKPGYVQDRAVSTRMQVPIVFAKPARG